MIKKFVSVILMTFVMTVVILFVAGFLFGQ